MVWRMGRFWFARICSKRIMESFCRILHLNVFQIYILHIILVGRLTQISRSNNNQGGGTLSENLEVHIRLCKSCLVFVLFDVLYFR